MSVELIAISSGAATAIGSAAYLAYFSWKESRKENPTYHRKL